MDTKIAKKMMLILLLLYVINSLHASSDWSIHLQAKSSLVYVNKRGGGHGGGGGHAGGGHVGDGNDSSGNGGSSRGGANGAGIPAHAAGGQQGPGRKNDGSLHTASLFRLTSTINVGEIVNVQEVYDGYSNIFSIELHHGGSFTKFPNIRYINGQVRYFDVVDIDEFSVHELDLMMRELGYDGTEIMYYHFRLPNEGFDFGLRALGNDDDVRNLSRYVTHNNKMIKVYTEHGQTNLLTYFMSPTGPRRVIIEDMEKQDSIRPSSLVVTHEVVTPIQIDVGEGDLGLALTLYKSATPEFSRSKGWKHSKGASSCSRQLNLDWEGAEKTMASGEVDKGKGVEGFVDEFVVVDAEKELNKEIDVNEELDVNKSNGEGVEGFADEGYRVVMDNDPQGVNEFSTNINIDDELMTNFQPFEGFEDQDSIPFNGFEGQDNIPFDDEWRQEEPDDIEFEDQNSEDEDSDFMIDEDNIIEDVDVDMEDFNLNIDTEAEFNGCQRMVGQRNEDSDEEDDLEVIDNDKWDSLSDDSGDNRKRREMIKELGKQTLCSAGEVHKVAFHIGQKYKAKKELKDKIDLHALETRRNISFTKYDKSGLTVVCDGTVVLNASGVGGPQSLSRKFLTVTCSKSQTTETKPTRQANTSSAGPLQPHTYSLFSTVLGMHKNDDQGFVKSMRFAQQQRSHRSRAPFLNLVAVEVDERRRRRIL
uniref:PB1-like domain-containing protein n=1 Tax=Lactuca sativa TaxID=4236 RepID=A0A9R1WJJ3_LACSA|nr:hypothetical protein LSAT_V11C100024700 [Lactuca sativa]